ncbi:hypothetical protein [Sulfobacillus thermosulfidooxidans]|uniref:hypothetical protein n=1 Tax=Sulfobacillus thermosulfidooxidans TaxID=28034 RepID=UPI00048F5EA3|nr:hypothetical protein [Sulfobacillus thermosulfidooxidans]
MSTILCILLLCWALSATIMWRYKANIMRKLLMTWQEQALLSVRMTQIRAQALITVLRAGNLPSAQHILTLLDGWQADLQYIPFSDFRGHMFALFQELTEIALAQPAGMFTMNARIESVLGAAQRALREDVIGCQGLIQTMTMHQFNRLWMSEHNWTLPHVDREPRTSFPFDHPHSLS